MAGGDEPSLKARVLRAGGWVFAGYGAAQVLRLGGNLIMTRLLVPEMFGVMAIVTMVMMVLQLLSDIGLRQNIVQSPRGNDPAFLDTAWTLQIVRGFLLWFVALAIGLVLYLAAGSSWLPPGSAFASPVLPFVIAASNFSLVMLGFQSTRVATAHRGLDQKRLVQIELIGQSIGLAAMILIAAAERTIWALVAGGLVVTLIMVVLSHVWLPGHRNRIRIEPSACRELMHFGKWIAASSALFVLASFGDRLILGALIDAQSLGYYAIAVLVVGSVEGVLGKIFQTVSLPALSEIARESPERMREIYYRMRLPADLLLLAVAGFLHATGPALIGLLYDPRYATAGEMLSVLSLSLFTVRFGVANQIYVALGVPRNQTVLNLVRFVALYLCVPAAYLAGGLWPAIWAIALHAVATLPLLFAFNSHLQLNDWRRELIVLAVLPAGWLGGMAVLIVLR